MSYLITHAAKNLLRHRKRTIVTACLLTAALAVVTCELFYLGHYTEAAGKAEEECSSAYYIAFRDDLQYLGNRRISSLQDDGSTFLLDDGTSVPSFDSTAMSAYDHPYPVTREMFETIADVPYVENYAQAYMTTAYGELIGNVPEAIAAFASGVHGTDYTGTAAEYTLFGGSMETLERYIAEQDPFAVWDFVLTSGRMPENDNECCISEAYAELAGLTVGDSLPLYDADGKPMQPLGITGLTKLYIVASPYDSMNARTEVRDIGSPDLNDLFETSGTPYDRITEDTESWAKRREQYPAAYRPSSSLLCVVFTTYDAAYFFYGTPETDPDFDNRHHFNHYVNYYTIRDEEQTGAWIEHIRSVLPADFAEEFTAYNSFRTYEKRSLRPLMMTDSAKKTILCAAAFALGILFITTLVTRRERSHETWILYSLGVTNGKLRLTYALENAMLALICCIASTAAGGLYHQLQMWMSAPESYFRTEQLTYTPPLSSAALLLLTASAAFLMSFLLRPAVKILEREEQR